MGEISDALVRAREEEAARDRTRERPPTASPSRSPSQSPPQSPPQRSPQASSPAPQRTPTARAPVEPLEALEPLDEEGGLEAFVPSETRPPAPEIRRHEIPRDQEPGWVSRLCAVEPHSPTAVRFRHFAVRIRSLMDQRSPRSLLVTSAIAGEGKTTVSVNLALAIASVSPDFRIALVDMDLRRSRVAQALRYGGDRGIEDVLEGSRKLGDVCVQTDLPGLDFYPAIRHIQDAHALLGGAADRVFGELHSRYDYVICDGPPVLPVPDVPLLTAHVGGCLAVVAAGRSRHAAFRDLLQLVPRSAWLGSFVNESRFVAAEGRYAYRYESDEVELSEEEADRVAGEVLESAGEEAPDSAADPAAKKVPETISESTAGLDDSEVRP